MFNILTFVQVAPATTDVHIILEVPATDKIHIEDRYGLAELSQTTRKTVNWFARKQLHLIMWYQKGQKEQQTYSSNSRNISLTKWMEET